MNSDNEIPMPANDPAPPGAEKPADPAPASAKPSREAELEAELAKLKDQLLRALAETENVRRRLEQQADERGRYAVSRFAKDMLTVADNLRRALDAIPPAMIEGDEVAKRLAEGVELTERGLLTALEGHGIRRIQAKGARFDPHLHQAMIEVEAGGVEPGTVVQEMQAGYTIHDRLLRPALVGVAKGAPALQPGAELDTKV